jgi:gluconolactonase
LCGPNDLVFDAAGMFWFTDTGKFRARDRDRGGVYWASPRGDLVREVIYPVDAPNGVGLSPDGQFLYYAETLTGRVYRRRFTGAGQVEPGTEHDPEHLLHGAGGLHMFDSLAVDGAGNVCVATLLAGCVTVVSPCGDHVWQLELPPPFEDPMVTNLCFTGEHGATAYLTLSATGRLIRCPWPDLRADRAERAG